MDQPKNSLLDALETEVSTDPNPPKAEDNSELALGRFSRRAFLAQLGVASVAATTAPLAHAAAVDTAETEAPAAFRARFRSL